MISTFKDRGVIQHMMKKVVLIGILCITAALLCQSVCASGIGISPTTISVSELMRGDECEKTVTVFNPNSEEMYFAIGAEGEAADWISITDSNDVPLSVEVIPPQGKKTLKIHIEIPSDASNGIYHATIYASTQSEGKTTVSGMQAVFKATCLIEIEVTDVQRLSGTVDYITVRDSEVNVPVLTEVKFTNTGNVIAKPLITVDIKKGGQSIEQLTERDVEISPGIPEIIMINWDTSEQRSGEYSADVSVSLDGKMIEQKQISFELFPVRTLIQKGEFIDLESAGDCTPGIILKIIGTFKNTGTMGTDAQLTGEVLKDGKLVGTIESKELQVPVYTSKQLTSYLDLTDVGDYVVRAHVIYSGKETDDKEITFQVSESGAFSGSSGTAAVPIPSETKTSLSFIPVICAILIAGLCLAFGKKTK